MADKKINYPDPLFLKEPHWLEYISPYKNSEPSFVCDEPGHKGLRAKYFQSEDKSLIGKAWFGPLAKGPPEHAHGGSQAALLDDAMGTVAWMAEIPVLAVNIQIDFKKMLPLGREVFVEAKIEKREGRKVFTCGKIFDDQQIYAQGKGLFLKLTSEQLDKLNPELAD